MEVGTNPSSHNNSLNASFNSEQSSFAILRNLKTTQIQYDQLCNRVKILRQHDETNQRKMLNNLKCIEKLEEIKEKARKDHIPYQELKKVYEERLEAQKKNNQKLKESILKFQQISKQNQNLKNEEIHRQIVNQSKLYKKNIDEFKQANQQKNRKKREIVVEAQQKSKYHLEEIRQKKFQSISEEQSLQRSYLIRKQIKKEKEIEKLSHLEVEMMKKSSQSHMALQSVKNKLDFMLLKVRHSHSNSKSIKKDKDAHAQKNSDSFCMLTEIKL